jgi:hypothetical protein
MQDELYADSIAEITVTGTIIRIDFSSLSPSDRDAAGQPKSVFRQRVVMSVEGFANSFEVLNNAMQGLIDAGAIRRNAPADIGAPTSNKRGAGPQGGSPNFV